MPNGPLHLPPQRPLFSTALEHLQIMLTDDGSRTLFDRRLNETYHSGCGALSECLYVYLRNSRIEAILAERGTDGQSPADNSWSAVSAGFEAVRVLEFGFGTGMAALLTMAAAKANGCPIDYISLEKDLLPVAVLRQLEIGRAVTAAIEAGRLDAQFAVAVELERSWLDFRAELAKRPSEGHQYVWDAGDNACLHLVIGDASVYAERLEAGPPAPFDAIYFDAFSPASNPELWSSELFSRLISSLAHEGLLVSYCVSGHVRRSLEQAGFQVARLPGPPGGKREVLAARHRVIDGPNG